ncbi:MAG: hypothetical protein AAF591_07735 [Verrucomicrobiota bacterium]
MKASKVIGTTVVFFFALVIGYFLGVSSSRPGAVEGPSETFSMAPHTMGERRAKPSTDIHLPALPGVSSEQGKQEESAPQIPQNIFSQLDFEGLESDGNGPLQLSEVSRYLLKITDSECEAVNETLANTEARLREVEQLYAEEAELTASEQKERYTYKLIVPPIEDAIHGLREELSSALSEIVGVERAKLISEKGASFAAERFGRFGKDEKVILIGPAKEAGQYRMRVLTRQRDAKGSTFTREDYLTVSSDVPYFVSHLVSFE